MKKMLIAAIASALVLMVAFPVSAGTNVTRTVGGSYNFPSLGQGDVGGFCLGPDFDAPQFDSCITVTPAFGEDHVSVTVTDSAGAPVYISIQQDNNPNFDVGCGTIVDFPIVDSGPGGSAADDVVVFPWPGPGIDDALETGDVNDACVPGSTNLAGGTSTFTFYDDVA